MNGLSFSNKEIEKRQRSVPYLLSERECLTRISEFRIFPSISMAWKPFTEITSADHKEIQCSKTKQ